MGIETALRDEAGTLLGASEVTMLDMARVYGTFANQGTLVKPISIQRITDRNGEVIYEAKTPAERSKVVLQKDVNYLITDGLRSVFRYGTAARFAEMSSYAGGKTGTTNESRDNWFCGFTGSTVSIVWVGADHYKGFLGNETGSTLALPVWESFMRKSFRVRPPPKFVKPDNIVEHAVNPLYGNLDSQGITMPFIVGKEPNQKTSDMKDLSQIQDYRNLYGQ
jgi:penicillin-binding protein 1A